MQQPQQRPNFFAMFVQTAARAGLAGLERAPVGTPSKGGKDKGSNCTPCAAQARREAAAKMVRGE